MEIVIANSDSKEDFAYDINFGVLRGTKFDQDELHVWGYIDSDGKISYSFILSDDNKIKKSYGIWGSESDDESYSDFGDNWNNYDSDSIYTYASFSSDYDIEYNYHIIGNIEDIVTFRYIYAEDMIDIHKGKINLFTGPMPQYVTIDSFEENGNTFAEGDTGKKNYELLYQTDVDDKKSNYVLDIDDLKLDILTYAENSFNDLQSIT